MPDPRMKNAIEHHRSGRLPEAEDIYRAILQDDAGHPDVHARLGEIAYRTGHFKDAARLLHQALQLQPEKPEIWKQLIEALVKAGYEDDAAKVLEEAQQLGLITVNTRP
ncbi:MAG: tetratricopeptide repeat protein [Wenzhouxiangella sp.]|nr:tetratricopeptide repeat protein [Wenzhouxiangella sp.]